MSPTPLNFVPPDFLPAAPEIFVLSMACIILIVDLFLTGRSRIVTYLLAQATLVIAAILTVYLHAQQPVLTFSGTFINDTMGDVLKVFIYLITAVVFLYSRKYLGSRALDKGEYYVLGLFAVLGMMVMVSAHSLLTIYLGLELMSLSLYSMVALQRDSAIASEAAMSRSAGSCNTMGTASTMACMMESLGLALPGNAAIPAVDSRRRVISQLSGRRIVEMVREAGATEVHMRISCPPTAHSCYYGVDTPDPSELIAARMSVEKVCEYIGVDSLGYLSLEGMLEAIGIGDSRSCSACWTGKYPTLTANGKAA